MLDLRELSLPIIGAPMAGGPGTPALAAEVSEAGGLGFVATGYQSPDAVAADLEAVRALTSAPFGVNLFVVEPYQPDAGALDAYRRSLEPVAARFDVALGEPRWEDDAWRAKCAQNAASNHPRRVVARQRATDRAVRAMRRGRPTSRRRSCRR